MIYVISVIFVASGKHPPLAPLTLREEGNYVRPLRFSVRGRARAKRCERGMRAANDTPSHPPRASPLTPYASRRGNCVRPLRFSVRGRARA